AKAPIRSKGIPGSLNFRIPVPCQPLLNAALASLTGTLTPPPNPIVIGLIGEADARLEETNRSSSMAAMARGRIFRPPSGWLNAGPVKESPQGSQAVPAAQARPTRGSTRMRRVAARADATSRGGYARCRSGPG